MDVKKLVQILSKEELQILQDEINGVIEKDTIVVAQPLGPLDNYQKQLVREALSDIVLIFRKTYIRNGAVLLNGELNITLDESIQLF